MMHDLKAIFPIVSIHSSNAQPDSRTDLLANSKNTGSLPDLTSFHMLLPTQQTNLHPPGGVYQQHQNASPSSSHYNNCTYDTMENNTTNPVMNSYDNKNQVLDFQVLQMLNNPNEPTYNIKVRLFLCVR